jgi:small subunit ribosomal protein S2
MKRELEKLQRALGGVKYMRRLPQAIVLASVSGEKIALAEAKLLRIPTIGIVDTDADPMSVNVPIFGNDNSNEAVAIIMTLLADAIATAHKEPAIAAYKADPKFEGIVENERKPRFAKNNGRKPAERKPAPRKTEDKKEEK